MARPDIFFGEGDRAPVVTDTLIGADGEPIDLTGATVVMRFRLKDETDSQTSEAVDVVGDPADGEVEWTPATGRAAGDYNANWVVTMSGGEQVTVPNDRYLWMQVQPAP
jgi:hypothetical protein